MSPSLLRRLALAEFPVLFQPLLQLRLVSMFRRLIVRLLDAQVILRRDAFLEIMGKKAAGYLNFDYLNHIWVYNSGLDRSFLELSPGWVLLGYLLQWANENKRASFDFMRGDEAYKYRFGAVDKFLVRVKVSR